MVDIFVLGGSFNCVIENVSLACCQRLFGGDDGLHDDLVQSHVQESYLTLCANLSVLCDSVVNIPVKNINHGDRAQQSRNRIKRQSRNEKFLRKGRTYELATQGTLLVICGDASNYHPLCSLILM